MSKISFKFKFKFITFVCLMSLASITFTILFLTIIDKTVQNIVVDNLSLFLVFCLISISICFLISHFYTHRSLASFFQLSTFARQVKDTGDYSLRFEPSGGIELFTLGQNINEMLNTIGMQSERTSAINKRLVEAQMTMDKLAQYDSLTGLPNRKYFMETLERVLAQSKRNNKNIALMFFDLDGFKVINDTYGHEVGDTLLTDVSRRARALLQQGDLIARLGDDEFLILLYNDPDEVRLNEIAMRLAAELSQPYFIETWELNISVSIGISVASDSDFDIKEFVSNADIAMYRSKDEGPGNYTVFAPYMKEEKKRRLEIANALNHAISENEFHLVYQAKVNSEDIVVGYEALIRWNSASLGFISPVEFIQVAEQCGKISLVTFWVLEQLCQDIDTFIHNHGQSIKVSFNLSAHDIKNPKLSKKIRYLFKQYNVDGRNLEIEVTESTYLDNFELANTFFEDMASLNCSIALDDFGTGYSSLGYLSQINIDTLKVDKQFIDNVAQSSKYKLVTKAIIQMGRQLGLEVCAEGVETLEQATFLKDCGCHQLQGYLYSKPIPLTQLFHSDGIVST